MEKEDSKLDKIVSCVALFCIGICFVVWADQVTEWIAVLFGVIALVYAIVSLAKFLKAAPEHRTTLMLFYIILSAAAGILLVSRASFIKEAISFVIGVYIILTSSVQLLNLADVRRLLKAKIGSYLWPIVGIIVGILCVTGQFIIPNELARLTGVVLIIYAIVYLTGFITFSSKKKKFEKELKDIPHIQEGKIVEEKKTSKKSEK
ncbi:DUF308 domain-containing protein [Candidatus Saccharibacteria bacterium]|nr:DUF308 domain-containing protein [Candidatus Saccharibacteria bacterium]